MTNGRWYNSLRIQIIGLLTIALLPLGAVAIYQTSRVEDQAHRNERVALLAVTGQTAKTEELFIQRAIGVARFFAANAQEASADLDTCNRTLRNFVDQNDTYSFIGVLPLSGVMTCNSTGVTFDASTGPYFADLMETPERTIIVNRAAPLSQESIFNISEPFEIDGVFAGYISISIPHRGMPTSQKDLADMANLGFIDLITITTNGDVFTSRSGLDTVEQQLPADRDVSDLLLTSPTAFSTENRNGDMRTYTVVPIDNSPATVVGIWTVNNGPEHGLAALIKPAIFPILMWISSLAVAMMAIYQLVLRHVTRLRRNMDEFALTRSVPEHQTTQTMPNELRALAENFDSMTDDIMREEAALEDTLREKNVLIKEVHHRVKNNLQLISSIMNMHIRTAEHDETKSVLSRLQDRVLSLATIHRDLYQSENGGLVNAGALLTEIVEKTVEVAASADGSLDVKTDFDRVLLYPDQVVPLSLLVSEAMTNAMKYLGSADITGPWVTASLKQNGADCVLTLKNSIGGSEQVESTGLGAQLINAFSIQLGGTIDIVETPECYTLALKFKIADFVPDARDF